MKVSALKEVILEIITEEMFGKRIKVQVQGNLYPALISRNTRHPHYGEGPYRITWFDPKNMEPLNHMDFNFEALEYILKNQKLPPTIVNHYIKHGLNVPQLIFEVKRSGPIHPSEGDILVGTIDPEDGQVDAKFGGTHKTMPVRNNEKGNWRFNDETRIVYWHASHPKMYEKYVEAYVERNMRQEVKQHLTLDNIKQFPEIYQQAWDDMHGIDSDM